MNGITAYVWAYNEEKRIECVLKHLSMFDEVVVFDKSSSDNTKRIAEEAGARVIVLPYFDDAHSEFANKYLKAAFDSFNNSYAIEVTCSDVFHPLLYNEMIKAINGDYEYDYVEIPYYRYSMGFTSKYSAYGELTYQAKVYKVSLHNFGKGRLHEDPFVKSERHKRLEIDDKKIAIYHLTHESLDVVFERHLRYAKIEASQDCIGKSRDTYLSNSWRKILGVVKRYLTNRTYKLGDKGRAQLCMLLLYRCANYLNLYFTDEETERIKRVYDDIRNDKMW